MQIVSFRMMAFAGMIVSVGSLGAETIEEDRTYDSAATWTVDSGVTDVMKGKITAALTFTKAGAGTLVLSNSGNTFGGRVSASAGILQVDAEGALGSGAVSVSTGSGGARLMFNAAGKTFSNAISLGSGAQASYSTAPLTFLADTTLSGEVKFEAGKNYIITDDTASKPLVVFDGPVTHGTSTTLSVAPSGTFRFNGNVKAGVLGTTEGSVGSVIELRAPENQIGTLKLGVSRVDLYAEDVIDGAMLRWDLGGGGVAAKDEYAPLYLHADQHVGCLTWESNAKYPGLTSGAQVYSDGPVTLTTEGTAEGKTAYCRLNGEITLVKTGAADTVQVLKNRAHSTVGRVIVESGTLRLEGTTSFPNVPEVVVNGGTLDLQSTSASSFASVTNIEVNAGTFAIGVSAATPFAEKVARVAIGSDGCLDSAAALTISADAFYANGSDEPEGYGTFTAATHPGRLGANVTVVVERPEHVYTEDSWVGGAEDADVTTPGNWKSGRANDFETGDFTPTFAETGDRAVISSAIALRGIVLAAQDSSSFTLAKGDDVASISLGEQGISVLPVVQDEAVQVRAYTNEVPLALSVTEQEWTVPDGSSLVMTGDVLPGGAPTVRKTGAGSFEMNGAYGLAGDFALRGGQMTVRGVFGVEDDTGTLSVSSGTGYEAKFRLAGATIRKAMTNYGSGLTVNPYWMTFASGTTNVVEGEYYSSTKQYFTMEPNAEVTFTGGIRLDADFIVTSQSGADGARFIIRDNPLVTTTSSKGGTSLATDIVFDSTGNVLKQYLDLPGAGHYVEFCRNDAFTTCPELRLSGGEIRLNGTHQSWPLVKKSANKPAVAVTGSEGSELEVSQGADDLTVAENRLDCRFEGFASLRKSGTGSLFLTNSVSTSCGGVTVSGGLLRFGANASWLNGTNVTVCGSGCLRLDGKDTFGKQCKLALADDGVLSVPAGTRLKVASATVDGVPLDPGTYSARTADTNISKHFAADGGELKVLGGGLLLLFR